MKRMGIEEQLRKVGISDLYPTQKRIVKEGLIEKGNFVLAAPTASGKTLAAELVINEELYKGGKVRLLHDPSEG